MTVAGAETSDIGAPLTKRAETSSIRHVPLPGSVSNSEASAVEALLAIN